MTFVWYNNFLRRIIEGIARRKNIRVIPPLYYITRTIGDMKCTSYYDLKRKAEV